MPVMNDYEATAAIRSLPGAWDKQTGKWHECIIADYYEIYVKEERRTLILQSVFFLHISRLKKNIL